MKKALLKPQVCLPAKVGLYQLSAKQMVNKHHTPSVLRTLTENILAGMAWNG